MKKKLTKKRLILYIVLLVFAVIFCIVNNKWLTVTEHGYMTDKLPDGCAFTVVQISDLHNANFGIKNRRLVAKIEALSPDLIVITGDIVDSNRTRIKTATNFCEKAADICPVYYVTGNHEHWLDGDKKAELFDGIRKSGAVILDDEAVGITINGGSFTLCGLDDESLYNDTLVSMSEEFDGKQLNILLAHEPQYFDDYCASPADLVLTGHAHGGQVRLPFVGGLVAPDQGFFPEYTEGERSDNGTTMIISRGLGNSVIPLRVFDLPEIVCVRVSGK